MNKIEKAKADDVIEIKKLLRETWDETYSGVYSSEDIEKITSEWHDPKLLVQQIKDPKIVFLIVKDGEKIIAMCNTDKVEGEIVNIQRLHVRPGYQRQGLGSLLINEIIKNFPQAKKIELEVEKHNHRAMTFYEKQGFKKVREKVFEVQSVQMPSFIMEKEV